MDLKLKITQKEGTNMSRLVKQMCTAKCRINVDVPNGEISINDMDDNIVENIIDSINESFNILGVDIIPDIETPKTEETVVPVEPVVISEPVVTADSLEIKKVEFSNTEVEDQLNKLMRVIYWAMYSNKAPALDICRYLMAAGTEIAMKYNPRKVHNFSVGDIVVCNYGNHLSGEISGGYVHSIVCDIDKDGTFYAAPITKARMESDSLRYLPIEVNSDADYTNTRYTGGTVLLRKSSYIRPERIQEIVGKVRPEFFGKLLSLLPDTIRFSHDDYAEKVSEKYGDVDTDDNTLFDDSNTHNPEIVSSTDSEETSEISKTDTTVADSYEEGLKEFAASDSSTESAEEMNEAKTLITTKKLSVEDYLEELISDSIASLDKSKPVSEQIDMFLSSIEFQTNSEYIKRSFECSCDVKRISYEIILLELFKLYPEINCDTIKLTMQDEFKNWIALYPDVKEKYPKISFMTLLKVFAKNMK